MVAGKLTYKASEIGKLIYYRYRAGDLVGIIRDPAIMIRDAAIGKMQKGLGYGVESLFLKTAGEKIQLK
jgi:hypothetical protein